MATKVKRKNSFEYRVKRKGVLDKIYTRSFKTEEEGDRVIAQIEAQLSLGILPPDLQEGSKKYLILTDVIKGYLLEQPLVSDQDKRLLGVIRERVGYTQLSAINYEWVERWISGMKIESPRKSCQFKPLIKIALKTYLSNRKFVVLNTINLQ